MADVLDTRQPEQPRRATALWVCLGGALLLLISASLYFCFSQNPVIVKYRALAQFYSSKREVAIFVGRFGPYAPLAFILIQASQVVLAPVPGEATGILGGYLFGTGLGFLYSTAGLTLGSVLAFGLGRWLGLPIVRRVVSKEVYHRFDFISRAGGELVTLVCFLIPGFPKDYLCFLLGVSPLQFGMFLVISFFGRMPGTWLLSIQGAKVRSAQYTEFVIYLLVAAAAAVLAYIYREAIFQWMRRRHGDQAGKKSSDTMDL
ncbi:MAG TPA: VTT domain-containing protein [Candidatus Methylomirabilis sp.]|nr:VTT domain-containing protein [Candidatus Methylomirabilis sp.]